jgi:hypothetical protein
MNVKIIILTLIIIVCLGNLCCNGNYKPTPIIMNVTDTVISIGENRNGHECIYLKYTELQGNYEIGGVEINNPQDFTLGHTYNLTISVTPMVLYGNWYKLISYTEVLGNESSVCQ